jgi:hypothetical protein
MIKAQKTLGIEGSYLNKIKAVYYRLTPNVILNGKNKIECISSKIRNKAKLSIISTLIQYRAFNLSQSKLWLQSEKK